MDDYIKTKELKDGAIHNYINGNLHSVNKLKGASNDRPGYIYFNESNNKESYGLFKEKRWYLHGKESRDNDKPAITKTIIDRAHSYYHESVTNEKTWVKNGKLHRDGDKPAVINHIVISNEDKRTVIVSKKWCSNGKLHRDGDKPAIYKKTIYYNKDGKITQTILKKEFWVKGKRHRYNSKPALKDSSMLIKSGTFSIVRNVKESYYFNGKLHRDGDKPAVNIKSFIQYMNSKHSLTSSSYSYYKHDKLHRDGDKPAIIEEEINPSGNVTFKKEIYFKNDLRHRDNNKPAFHIKGTHEETIGFYNHGALDNVNYPAVIVKLDDRFFFQYHRRGIRIFNDVQDKKFLIKQLLENDISLSEADIENYPYTQICSILQAVTGKEYSQEVSMEYLEDDGMVDYF